MALIHCNPEGAFVALAAMLILRRRAAQYTESWLLSRYAYVESFHPKGLLQCVLWETIEFRYSAYNIIIYLDGPLLSFVLTFEIDLSSQDH